VTLPATTLPVDVLHLEMMVTDRAAPNPHLLLKQVSFSFAPKPAVDSCSPLSGPAAGGTVVAISGTNFVPTQPGIATETGTEVLLRDDLGATVLPQGDPANGKMITVRVPPHPPGQVTLLVRNGPATDATSTACTFTYLPAPRVRLVTPAAGPASGGTRVTINGNHFLPGARVSLVGDVDGGLLCAVRVSDQRIDAVMPPGRGAVAFVVDTGIAGQSPAYAGFVYDEAAPSEPGPPTCTGGGAP
jgi:hypothetical protein